MVVRQLKNDETEFSGGFQDLTVINKTAEKITFYSPYVSLGDFISTCGVIPYVGIRQWDCPIEHPMKYKLIDNIFRPGKLEQESNLRQELEAEYSDRYRCLNTQINELIDKLEEKSKMIGTKNETIVGLNKKLDRLKREIIESINNV